MPCNHSTHSCKLRGKCIVVDANFVIDIVDFLSSSIRLENSDWRAQLNSFKQQLSDFLGKCGHCSTSDRVFTSNRVFSIEINPNNNRSSIRRKSSFLKRIDNDFHRESANFFSELHSIIQARIEPIHVEVEDLESIKSAVAASRSLRNNDVSLIASAILKSNQISQTFVITRDENLVNAVAEIYGLSSISLGGRSLQTRGILTLDTCSYTSFLHRCCELSNHEQVSIIRLVATGDMIRRINDRKRRIKGRQLDSAFGEFQKSMIIKEQRRR